MILQESFKIPQIQAGRLVKDILSCHGGQIRQHKDSASCRLFRPANNPAHVAYRLCKSQIR